MPLILLMPRETESVGKAIWCESTQEGMLVLLSCQYTNDKVTTWLHELRTAPSVTLKEMNERKK